MSDMLVHAIERPIEGFTDPRALWGSPVDPNWRPAAQPVPDPRREAWAYIDRQWELWPRPDLIRAILPPACVRPSRRFRR